MAGCRAICLEVLGRRGQGHLAEEYENVVTLVLLLHNSPREACGLLSSLEQAQTDAPNWLSSLLR